MDRKAKIVATIGPASQDSFTIERLLLAGMDVARLNFSHGTHETHADTISSLRSISSRLGRPLAILQDLQGPKISRWRVKYVIEAGFRTEGPALSGRCHSADQ